MDNRSIDIRQDLMARTTSYRVLVLLVLFLRLLELDVSVF